MCVWGGRGVIPASVLNLSGVCVCVVEGGRWHCYHPHPPTHMRSVYVCGRVGEVRTQSPVTRISRLSVPTLSPLRLVVALAQVAGYAATLVFFLAYNYLQIADSATS